VVVHFIEMGMLQLPLIPKVSLPLSALGFAYNGYFLPAAVKITRTLSINDSHYNDTQDNASQYIESQHNVDNNNILFIIHLYRPNVKISGYGYRMWQ
jgi:hypothetical protein